MSLISSCVRSLPILLALALAPSLAAQYNTSVFDLKKAQDLYDERGFEQGSVISVDGRLNISNANGTVSYSYPISNYAIDTWPIAVDLNYCGSVAFTAYKEYNLADRELNTEYDGWNRFHQNRPAWILGVNGFAINVIATALTFRCHDSSRIFNPSITAFNDGDLNWVIDGYDVSNRMTDFGADAVPSFEEFPDVIRLLRAAGGTLDLYHRVDSEDEHIHSPDNTPEPYTGIYLAKVANDHGYAQVSYIDPEQIPAHILEELEVIDSAARFPLRPRMVRYFDGTGLEYLFREWPIP